MLQRVQVVPPGFRQVVQRRLDLLMGVSIVKTRTRAQKVERTLVRKFHPCILARRLWRWSLMWEMQMVRVSQW